MITVIQPDPLVTIDRFGPWLEAQGHLLNIIKLWEAPLPDAADCAGVIVLGGTMNAIDEHASPWLPALQDFLRSVLACEIPTLGICLGHQIIAATFGGSVTLNHREQGEDGPFTVTLSDAARTDPILQHLPAKTLVAESHYDVVEQLPASATLLASSERCPIQAFRLGSALCVQFHPEASPSTMGRWFALGGGDAHAMEARMHRVDAEVATTGQAIAEAFSAEVTHFAALHGLR